MRTIQQMWEQYRTLVIPHDASPTQVKESKRCFFAGAQALQGIMIQDIATLPDANAEDAMRAVDQELHNFSVDMVKGKA